MIKLITEILPLVSFFIGYKMGGIVTASIWIAVASTISLIVGYLNTKKIDMMTLASTIIVLGSTALTVTVGDSRFIKMKPTILYLLFSCVFFVTLFTHKTAIEYLLRKAITLKSNVSWRILNARFAIFFFFMAIFNEVIWRYYSEELWVNAKVFGFLPLTIIFILFQTPFILKNRQSDESEINANK